jgi:hypothetical protein
MMAYLLLGLLVASLVPATERLIPQLATWFFL